MTDDRNNPRENSGVADAELVQYIDGELTGTAKEQLIDRLSSTPDTAARLDTLGRRSARLSELLAQIDPSAGQTEQSADSIRPQVERGPRGRWASTPVLMKIAAAIVLLLGFSLALPPVRAWVADWLRDLRGGTPVPDVVAPAPPTPAAPADADVRVSFPVSAATFEIQLGDQSGILVVRTHSIVDGAAEARGVEGASFLILPGALRIEGPSSATAVYTVSLPSRVTAVRIRRPGRADAVYALSAAAPELRVDLTR